MHMLSVASVALLSTLTSAAALRKGDGCTQISGVTHTFYGFPDNDPPSAEIAYDCGRGNIAGGTGTYDDPLTFATAPGEFDQCEIIFDPYLQKYLRMEDYCEQCNEDWQNGQWHIDVWTGGNYNGGDAQIDCEDNLTPDSQTIIRNPRTDLQPDTTSLFDNGVCNTDHTYNDYNPNDYC